MSAALQFAVVVTVTTATVQEELIDAPVLDLLAVRGIEAKSRLSMQYLKKSANYMKRK